MRGVGRTVRCRVRMSAAMMLIAGVCVGGCSSPGPGLTGYVYPVGTPQTSTANIHVFRHETELRLTNSTARAIGPGMLWINSQFGREIDQLAVGQTLTMNLNTFQNEYGEKFRGGGFFATERPEPVVRAQIQSDEEMIGLIVVRD